MKLKTSREDLISKRSRISVTLRPNEEIQDGFDDEANNGFGGHEGNSEMIFVLCNHRCFLIIGNARLFLNLLHLNWSMSKLGSSFYVGRATCSIVFCYFDNLGLVDHNF